MKNLAVLLQLFGVACWFFVPPLGFLFGVMLIIVGGMVYRVPPQPKQRSEYKGEV